MDDLHVTDDGHCIGLPTSCFEPSLKELPDAPDADMVKVRAFEQHLEDLGRKQKERGETPGITLPPDFLNDFNKDLKDKISDNPLGALGSIIGVGALAMVSGMFLNKMK